MRLRNCKAEYKLANGKIIEVAYKEENFAHLLGLHKLKDIQLIQFWLDKNNKTVKLKEVIRRIKNSTFTDSMIKSSIFYSDIKDRYESFSYENLTTLTYTDAVINFNPSIIKSKIKTILFDCIWRGKSRFMATAKGIQAMLAFGAGKGKTRDVYGKNIHQIYP